MLRTEMTQRFWVKTALSDDFAQFMVTQPEYQVELEPVMRHETETEAPAKYLTRSNL